MLPPDASRVLEAEKFGPTFRIPHPRRPVVTPGDDPRRVRAERYRHDAFGVAFEREDLGARARVPYSRRPVVPPGQYPRAVRAEDRRPEDGVPLEGEDLRTGPGIPHPCRPV